MSDLTIVRGDDRTLTATIVEPDGTTETDLTGASLMFTIKRRAGDAEPVAVLTSADDEIIVDGDPADGVAIITLPRDLTATLSGIYAWDLQLTDAFDLEVTVDGGVLYVTEDVTDAGTLGPLVSLSTVRALVPTRLPDPDLRAIVDMEEAILAEHIGALLGPRTETFVVTDRTAARPVRLARRADSIVVTEANDTITDVRVVGGRIVQRLVAGDWSPGDWEGVVEVTYTPVDQARVTGWVIALVGARLAESVYATESIEGYTWTRAQRHADVLANAVADLTGRGAVGRATSRSLRSIRASTEPLYPVWAGSDRPS